MVSNLVKNWEKEASYKLKTSEWRTIDPIKYRFSCNGGPEVLSCSVTGIALCAPDSVPKRFTWS